MVGVEQVLQAEAVEETEELEDERPLPATARPAEVLPFSMEARTVAIAAAGGIVAGAATVAVVKAVSKAASQSGPSARSPGASATT